MRQHIERIVEGVARVLEATAVASTVSTGDFVKWKASKGSARGKVVSIHSSSKVPGVAHELVGTADAPAARVRLYAKSGNGWAATETYVPLPAGKLSTIDALPEPTLIESVTTAGSFDEIRDRVRTAISDRITSVTGAECRYVWVVDIGPDWVVYEISDAYHIVSYSIDDDSVTLGVASEVFKRTMWVTVDEPESDDPTAAVSEATERITSGRLLGAKGTDESGGRVFGVRILTYGDSKNGNRYTEAVMRTAVRLYEGAKAYDHHRSVAELTSSTIAGLIGTYRNVVATTEGIDADLHLLPGATHVAEALDASLLNQAAGLDPLVGISHDVAAKRKPIVANGRRMFEATEIVAVHSADVVADPSAGGHATRMVAGGIGTTPNNTTETTLNLKQLMALLRTVESAQRAALLVEHASVLEAAGITADDAVRMAEATAPTVATTVDDVTESTYSPASGMGRLLVERAVTEAKLGDHLLEAVRAELPAQFTEADLATAVARYVKITEGFELAGLRPRVPALDGITSEDHTKKLARWDNTMAGNFREGYNSIHQAYLDITGDPGRMSPAELSAKIMRESILVEVNGHRETYDSRTTESLETASWGAVLGDSITRRMVAEYAIPQLQSWRQVVSSIMTISDFRTQRIQRVGGYGTLPTVLEGGPYQPLTSPDDDAEVTYAIGKKGGTEDLTLEMIANDDLRALTRIPKALGRAAALTLHRFVWDGLILNNATALYDGVVLYHSTHANTASLTLSGSNLSAVRKKLMTQSAYGVALDILGLEPKFLVVPATLEELAWQLSTSAVAMPSGAPVGAASNIPNIHQGLTPIVLPHRDATSTSEWFVVADPALCPTVEVGFFQGREDPELFAQVDPTVGSMFNADKLTYKIRHIYGGAVLDYRPFQRGNS